MLFEQRESLTRALFVDAIHERCPIMVAGSGIWFEALKASCMNHAQHSYRKELDFFSRYTNTISFVGNGYIQFVDLTDTWEMDVSLDPQSSRTPAVMYLVEDSPGVHASLWDDKLLPFVKSNNCRLVYLGDKHGEPGLN